jgi:hypothetical protein
LQIKYKPDYEFAEGKSISKKDEWENLPEFYHGAGNGCCRSVRLPKPDKSVAFASLPAEVHLRLPGKLSKKAVVSIPFGYLGGRKQQILFLDSCQFVKGLVDQSQ